MYRTVANGSQLKLHSTHTGNGFYYLTDYVPDGSLGANAPTVNGALRQQVTVSGMALGPTGTTARKVYRSAANQTQLKLLATIANNTSTGPYVDSTADASLGVNAPTVGNAIAQIMSAEVNYDRTTRKLDVWYGGAHHLSNTALVDGTYAHVLIASASGAGTLYLNGVADNAFAGFPGFTPTAIGWPGGSDAFKGTLDEVAIYRTALTSQQAMTHDMLQPMLAGSGTVTYNVAANPTVLTRTATLTIAGQTVTLTQDGCGHSLSTPTTIAIDTSGERVASSDLCLPGSLGGDRSCGL